jgi:C4-dicarboxylate-specific signal transduction histidine kinase
VSVDRSYRRKDGSVFAVEINACQTAGGLVLGIVRDITERKQAEAELCRLHEELQRHAAELDQRVARRTQELLVAKERAEAADRVKSVFLATCRTNYAPRSTPSSASPASCCRNFLGH